MKQITRFVYIVSLITLVSSVLLINGCGSNKESERQGCPNGSSLANATDIITGPEDGEITVGSSFGNPSIGGTVLFTPVVFTVTDATAVPRNDVCLILYTDGFWYTDSTYSTPLTGTGPLNAIAVVTNDVGNALMYWSTEALPPANLSTTVAGTDQIGNSFVKAESGVLSDNFNVEWTVMGEPL